MAFMTGHQLDALRPATPEIRAQRFQKVLDQIFAEPSAWNQDTYATVAGCETTFCVAGWAAMHAGFQPILTGNLFLGAQNWVHFGNRDGLKETPGTIAEAWLDLNYVERQMLFHYYTKSPHQLAARMREILDGEYADDDEEVEQ